MRSTENFKKSSSRPNQEETNETQGGSHGSHWDAVVQGNAEIQEAVMGAVEEADMAETFDSQQGEIGFYLSPGQHIRTCTVTENSMVSTSYPFSVDGEEHTMELNDVKEWSNNLEAWLEGSIGPAAINFFDTLYFKEKDSYQKGQEYRFKLSGFAYQISKSEPETIQDGEGREFSTQDMAAFFPWSQGFSDDYQFQTVVKEIGELEFRGNTVYRITAPLFRDEETHEDYDVAIYVSENNLRENIQPEDNISGIMWLQGHLVDEL